MSLRQGPRQSRGVSPRLDLLVFVTLLLCVFLPTMLRIPMRTTGDEKTYIAQALEMAAHGTWFKQTLFDAPNYYKGPLYYVLLRLGFSLFGQCSPVALDYMNTLGYLGAGLALAFLMHRRLAANHGATLLAPAVVAFSAGGYAHGLASQMEAPLIAAYGAFLAVIGLAEPGPSGRSLRAAAWIVAGCAGWLKSPVHAALLGSSAVMFWLLTGELGRYVRDIREWGAATVGVACGIAGYLPAAIWDGDAFVQTYLLRETFSKGGGNGVSLDEALMPFFTAHLLPWSPLLVAGVITAVKRAYTKDAPAMMPAARRLLVLCVAVATPTLLFFAFHPYRNGIYILPVLPAAATATAVLWAEAAEMPATWWGPMRAAQWVLCAVLALVAVALALIIWRLSPWPRWWGEMTSATVLAGMALAVGSATLAATVAAKTAQVRLSVLACAAFFVSTGRVLIALSDHDRDGVTFVKERNAAANDPYLHLNLHGHLWSETGLLNPLLGHAVLGVYSANAVTTALRPGRVFLVPDAEQLASLELASLTKPEYALSVHPWPRWRIHGEAANGEPAWLEAWRQRSIAPLERNEFIVTVTTKTPAPAKFDILPPP